VSLVLVDGAAKPLDFLLADDPELLADAIDEVLVVRHNHDAALELAQRIDQRINRLCSGNHQSVTTTTTHM
jgi:hypothetical protein